MPGCDAAGGKILMQPVDSWQTKAIKNYCCKTATTSMKKKSQGNFDKFAKKKSNAAIKEQFRQEKRKWKKEREEFFEKKRLSKEQGTRYKAQDESEIRNP